MENSPKAISPEKITTPIQLLGAWLVGLLSIDSCFLFAAVNMNQTSWQSVALTVAAIVNVPLFIGAVFLLQTRFRPELQEDSYYSTYLNQKTNQLVKVPRDDALLSAIQARIERLEHDISETRVVPLSGEVDSLIADLTIGINHHLENHDEIQEKLFQIGVLGISKFGTDEEPKFKKVAVSPQLPKVVVRRITEIAEELGFEYFGFYDSDEIEEDVLFGAYGERQKIRFVSGRKDA